MAPITSAYRDFCIPRKEEKLPTYSSLLPKKNTYTCWKTRTPSSSTIGVDLHPIDMKEFPNNLNRRDLFLTTCGDIKKLQIRKVNNVITHVFPRRITRHSDETFNNLDSWANRNVFLKPSMVSHPLYHPNIVSNSCQPNKSN